MDFPSPDIPDSPEPMAPTPSLNPMEIAQRRAALQKSRISRDSFVIDPGTGMGNTGQTGTGLKIGQGP